MGIPIVTAPAQAMLMMLAGWLNREQQTVVEYQKEEIRILRELLGKGRPRLTDEHRRRLAIKSRGLSHQTLRELGSIVTPDTLTRWFRKYAGSKYDSSGKRRVGLHEDPRCDDAPRPRAGSHHGQAHPRCGRDHAGP